MTKIYFLSLLFLLATQAVASETDSELEPDSVYIWGAWENGLKPAAGLGAQTTPPPAETPNVNFRPNENSELLREAASTIFPTAPSINGAPQLPDVVAAPIDTPTTPINLL